MVCTLGCSDSGYCGSTCVTNNCGHCGVGECGGSGECSCTHNVRFDELASATYEKPFAPPLASTGGDFAGSEAVEVSTLRFASVDGRDVSRRICDASISERHYTEAAAKDLLRENQQIVL